ASKNSIRRCRTRSSQGHLSFGSKREARTMAGAHRLRLNRSKSRLLARRRSRPHAEALELRQLLSAIVWNNPAGGNWDNGANWQGGKRPGAGDTAVINTASAATISIQTGDNIQVQGVTTSANDTLSITGGSLTVTAGNSPLSGPLSMTGGSLSASG